MRTVARYSFGTEVPEDRDALQDFLNLLDRAEAWLSAKGPLIEDRAPAEVRRYPDGREGTVRRAEIDLGTGGLREIALSEPIEGAAVFETRLQVGLSERNLGVLCDLRVGGKEEPLGPVRFDASCPRIVRDFLSYGLPWLYGTFPLPKGVCRFLGNQGGDTLAQLLTNPHRLLPVVVVAEYQGFVLHPHIAEAISRDLASLAVVASVDDGASWRLTNTLGADWSCYNGAVRLYWPGLHPSGDPRTHPLWTARRLLDDVPDTAAAAVRIRNVLRRQLMSASSFAVREPALFDAIRAAERAQRFAAERRHLQSADDYKSLAESFAREAAELQVELSARKQEVEALRGQVENLQVALQWRDVETGDTLVPETAAPPTTVSEALERARFEGSDALVFGPAVEDGVAGLAADAGPPEKVLLYLTHLAELSRARAKGPLGTSPLEWLKERNVAVSQEGEGVQRHWDGRAYDWHLKPAEAVSPDRCVRIYFDWDDSARRTVIGWVGRHP